PYSLYISRSDHLRALASFPTRRSSDLLVVALGAIALVALAIGVWLVWIESKQLTWQALLNATYATSVTPRGAALHDGTFEAEAADRKSTRLNSSHVAISYAVFCLKKKN